MFFFFSIINISIFTSLGRTKFFTVVKACFEAYIFFYNYKSTLIQLVPDPGVVKYKSLIFSLCT